MKSKACLALAFLVGVTFCDTRQPLVSAGPPTAEPVVASAPAKDSTVDPAEGKYSLVDGKWVKVETVSIAAIVHVDEDAKGIKVVARKIVTIDGQDLVSAEVINSIPIEDEDEARCFGLIGPLAAGKYQIRVDSYDVDTNNWKADFLVLVLGEPEPEPDPDNPDPPEPDPDVPDDVYDNIGKRVAEWSAGLPKRQELGAMYLGVAGDLSAGKLVSINEASKKIVKSTKEILSDAEVDEWKPFASKLQDDLNGRWPLQRPLYVDYLKAVAKGLGAQ